MVLDLKSLENKRTITRKILDQRAAQTTLIALFLGLGVDLPWNCIYFHIQHQQFSTVSCNRVLNREYRSVRLSWKLHAKALQEGLQRLAEKQDEIKVQI